MQNNAGVVVILGTGGTIAGTAARADDLVGYTSAALGADDLVAAVPALAGQAIEAETLARLDSSDMDHATWATLRARAAFHLTRDEVAHVVVDGAIDTAFIRDNFPERYATKEQDGILNPDHIADNYWHLHQQPRDAWTHELDLRPWQERW